MAIELGGAPLVSALLTHLVPIVSEEIYHIWGLNDEMRQLQKTLEAIQGVLTDAERKQEDKNIKVWLQDLKDIAYDAQDILDEFTYESLRNEMETPKRKRIKRFFSSENFIARRIKMGSQLKDLNRKLVQIENRKNMFHLSLSVANLRISDSAVSYIGGSSRETISQVNRSEIIGRKRAAAEVKEMLFNSSTSAAISSSSIIRIVGMGGLGKTALAQIIYNDEDVLRQFKKRMWICISQHSDQKQVFNQLLESITGIGHNLSNLDTVVNSLKEELQNKRYLIVLDDMWKIKDNQWDCMLETLLYSIGAQGSKVIVTTRSNEIIASMGSSLSNYNLVGLSAKKSWVLLEKMAFGHEGVQPKNLIEIGKRIAQKCGGVPLAIKVLGRLMYEKRSEEEWRLIENNPIWDYEEGEEKIIKVLKLSYDHLEPHLQQCFTYCALFPKDYIIKRKTLIQLWMAEGFLSSDRSNTDMEVGDKYFNCLLRNSFFLDVKEDAWGMRCIDSCMMHDLVHDLAEYLTRSEISIIYVNKIPEEKLNSLRLRRVNLFTDPAELSPFPELLTGERKKLRTLLLRTFMFSMAKFVNNAYAVEQIFKNFSHLRVLDLSCFPIDELPPAIENFKYLRYLNLSESRLTKLPTSITTLYHLQILILEDCFQLKHLPRDLGKLKNMRHLIIRKTGYHHWIPPMPSQLRRLINLQYLPLFTVGNKDHGFGIEELGALNLLGDELHIHNLENVSSREEAAGAQIGKKQHIRWLELHWTVTVSHIRNDFEVLQGLQPHRNLKKLGIYNYVGSNFSTWLKLNNLLPNLVHITLENCTTCESLPPLGLLPSLRVLRIEGFPALKSIGSDFFDGNSCCEVFFPYLEDLSICRMDNLEEIEEWNGNMSSSSSSFSLSFPVLKELKIKFCPKLRIMPTRISSLTVLFINGCKGNEAISSLLVSNSKSLISVTIWDCHELLFLPLVLLKGNHILHTFMVNECPKLENFIVDPNLIDEEDVEERNLRTLCLTKCPALFCRWPNISRFNYLESLSLDCISQMSLPIGIEKLPRLHYLEVGPFLEDLGSFPFPAANIAEGRIVDNYFPSLVNLILQGWSKLNFLPDQIQYITSLQELSIYEFDSLEVLPEWLGNMDSLTRLELRQCKNLVYLPSEEQVLRLTSLEWLEIQDCPLLADRCQEGGEEQYKLVNIPNVLIDEY